MKKLRLFFEVLLLGRVSVKSRGSDSEIMNAVSQGVYNGDGRKQPCTGNALSNHFAFFRAYVKSHCAAGNRRRQASMS